jgi:hypothetical protein
MVFVGLAGNRRAHPLDEQFAHHHDSFPFAALDGDLVSDPHGSGGFGAFPADPDVPRVAGVVGLGAGLEEAYGPEPRIDPDFACRYVVPFAHGLHSTPPGR